MQTTSKRTLQRQNKRRLEKELISSYLDHCDTICNEISAHHASTGTWTNAVDILRNSIAKIRELTKEQK